MYYQIGIEITASGDDGSMEVVATTAVPAEPSAWCSTTDISASYSFGDISGYAYYIQAVVSENFSPEHPIMTELASLGFPDSAARRIVGRTIDFLADCSDSR